MLARNVAGVAQERVFFCLRGALHCMTIKKYITGVCMIIGPTYPQYTIGLLLTTTAGSSVAYERQVVGMTGRAGTDPTGRLGGAETTGQRWEGAEMT